MHSLNLGIVAYLELVPELRNRANTVFQTLYIEFYSFPLAKVDEIELSVCITTKVRESM